MALKQKTFKIYTRIKIDINGNPVYMGKNLNVYMNDPFSKPQGGQDPHVPAEVGGEKQDGLWVEVFSTTSYDQAKVEYKKLLKTIGREFIKMEEVVPMGTIISPIS